MLVAEDCKRNFKAPEGRKVILVCSVVRMPYTLKIVSMDTELNADFSIPDPRLFTLRPSGAYSAWH